jgi:hypothetical protein
MSTITIRLVRYSYGQSPNVHTLEIAFTPGNREDGHWSKLNGGGMCETLDPSTNVVSYSKRTKGGNVRREAQGVVVREYTKDIAELGEHQAPVGTAYVLEGLAANAPKPSQARFADEKSATAWAGEIIRAWRADGYTGGAQLRGLRADVGLVATYGRA